MIDVWNKSENKECGLNTCNWFNFVVSHLAEDNRLSQCFIERGNVIFRIGKYPQNQFRFTVLGQFLFIHLQRSWFALLRSVLFCFFMLNERLSLTSKILPALI